MANFKPGVAGICLVQPMCGRFTLRTPSQELCRRFGVKLAPPAGPPRYNIAPTERAWVIPSDRPDQFVAMRWGLIPPWAADERIGLRCVNARAETLCEKPAFREAVRLRRCLIPADGLYEWQTTGPYAQPWFMQRPDGQPFALAGLWERWSRPGGSVIESFAVVTVAANAAIAPLHDRMAALVEQGAERIWLRGSLEEALALLRPCPPDWLELRRVSTAVNRAGIEGPHLIAPVEPPPEQGRLFD